MSEDHMTEEQFQSVAATALLKLINDRGDTIKQLRAENEQLRESLEALARCGHALYNGPTMTKKDLREVAIIREDKNR